MFRFFKKKSKREKLEAKFKRLMQEWHELSSINRSKSDAKYAEAQLIAQQINEMKHEAA
ncbi:Lacal_2735 family protein [Hyunsoonleella aestuarii]|uniref:Lacal_2735 family protein n=1 Tax=Hyunsoonleella aestuarii TaxID=912802 RepID=A0ABP8EBI2_9FLAO|nr:Lacal_2735 family protein [Hyunsoonleella aestuarii]